MVKWRRTPAIFAGLAGSAVWSVPVLAQAAPTDEVLVTMNDLLASPVAYFFVGLGAGAVVTGVCVGAAGHHARKRLSRELGEARKESESLRAAGLVIHVSAPGVVLDLTGGAVPAATGGEGVPVGDTARLARRRPDTTADLGRAGARPAPAPEEPAPAPRPHVRESVPQLEDMPSFTTPHRVRHSLDGRLPGFGGPVGGSLEPATPASPTPRTGQQAAASQGGAFPPAAPATTARPAQAAPSSPAQQAPAAGPTAPADSRHHSPEQDYERIAEEYVKESKAAERQSRKSRGVRAILSERLHGNVMDGLPVIERADGSTNDIGTSWWAKEVGSTHSFAPLDPSRTADLPPVTEAPDPMSTTALRRAELARAQRNAEVAGFSGSLGLGRTGGAPSATLGGMAAPVGAAPASPQDTARLDRTQRAATIADRLSSVDMSLYPEEHAASAEGEGDMFEQALRAMDEQDSVTTVTTSSESSTTRVPLSGDLRAGAVVSSESLAQARQEREVEEHVDSLVRDEFERNRARHNQRTAHSILTVFDGTGDLSDARSGRHFSQPDQGASARGEEQAR